METIVHTTSQQLSTKYPPLMSLYLLKKQIMVEYVKTFFNNGQNF